MNDHIVLLDLETTGLDPSVGAILECGILVATKDFEILGSKSLLLDHDVNWDYVDVAVRNMHNKRQQLENPRRYVSLMEDIVEHRQNGLLQTHEQAANRFIGWLEAYGVNAKSCALTGSTIGFDRGWLQEYMKDLDDYFDYHSVDISSFQIAFTMFANDPSIMEAKPTDRKMHRAIPDCEDSLTKYRWAIAAMRKGLNHASDDR